jgi:hypothetical protein
MPAISSPSLTDLPEGRAQGACRAVPGALSGRLR